MSDNEEYTGLEIAVIGISCRFPGAGDAGGFWENLKNGVESISFFSDEELEQEGVSPEMLKQPGYVKAKGVVEGIEYFDHVFFDYTPREARWMDPQFRLLHECAWSVLEDGGYDSHDFTGGIGLYAGSLTNLPWMKQLMRELETLPEPEQYDAFSFNDRDFLTTRVSYKLNLRGPSFTLQTACSTSLVAIHLACQGLLSGECDMAIAGGVSVMLPRRNGYLYREGMIKSPDGHCRAFDAAANGTNGGDGVGLVLLKRLEDAIADGDNIYAVVKGSAVNNDGIRKIGYTAPSVEGQVEVIRAAQQMAEVEPGDISYIEAHGTATVLGDPIEVEALKRVFEDVPYEPKGCGIGSVKTNVGHLDAAAGAAGFIKTVLSLRHGYLPPSLHFKEPNPRIDFVNSPFYVNNKLTPWKREGSPLRAGVSSFGIGGTNAHVVLEGAPGVGETEPGLSPYQLLVLSARSEAALDGACLKLSNYFKENEGISLADAAYTLQVGRRRFEHRKTVVCSSIPEAAEKLPLVGGPGGAAPWRSPRRGPRRAPGGPPEAIFMFPGQGVQYIDMGRGLYEAVPVFSRELDGCFGILKDIVGVDLGEVLYPRGGSVGEGVGEGFPVDLNQTWLTQPLLFSFQYALARLLMGWGIEPYAMIGHSIGEYTAACLSGVFSLEDALRLVAERGRLMQTLPGGSMLSVPLAEAEVLPLLEGGELSLAAVNSTAFCVVSGPDRAVNRLEKQLRERGLECRRLVTSHAFHSGMMDSILEEFRSVVARVTLSKPGTPYISNVSGDWITVEQAADPGYWAQQLRGTVRFSEGCRRLLESENLLLLEVGPGRGLSTLVRKHASRGDGHELFTLVRHRDNEIPGGDYPYLLEQVGELWRHGVRIDWPAFHAPRKRRRVSLPGYVFDRYDFGVSVAPPGGVEGPRAPESPVPVVEAPDVKAPGDVLETINRILHEVLGIAAVDENRDFFQLGGDSLKAVSLGERLSKAFNVEVPLRKILSGATVSELAAFIRSAGRRLYQDIRPVPQKEYYPLSSAQKRLYFLGQLENIGTSYNMTFVLRLLDPPDEDRIREVFGRLIRRHETLRTSFHLVDALPVQKVHPPESVSLELGRYRLADYDDEIRAEGAIEKLTGEIAGGILCSLQGDRVAVAEIFGTGEADRRVEAVLNDFMRPFDLSVTPLLRAALVEHPGGEYLLLFDTHHIISDSTSMGILTNEFMRLYAGEELEPLPVQYKDFAGWQNRLFESGAIEEQEEYWLSIYSDAPDLPVLNLPTDFRRPGGFHFEGARYGFKFGLEETRRFRELAVSAGATLYMNLLAALNVLFFKYTGQTDIIIGGGGAGRHHVDLQHVIGMFVNAWGIRNAPVGVLTYREFLLQVKENSIQAFENQDAQFEMVVERLNLWRESSRNPLFDVFLGVQNYEQPSLDVAAQYERKLGFIPYEYENKIAKFDMTWYAYEVEGGLYFSLEYSTALFKPVTAEQMAGHFLEILEQVIEDPEKKLADFTLSHDLEAVEQELPEDYNDDFDF